MHFNNIPGEPVFESLFQQRIKESISTISIAMYSFSLKSIHDELEMAQVEGRDACVVVDGRRNPDLAETFLLEEQPKYHVVSPVTTDFSRMHHKFMVIDEKMDRAQAFIGSCNLTRQQVRYDPGAFIEIHDPTIAGELAEEIGRIRRGTRGRAKLQDPSYRPLACTVRRGDENAELWFSPGFGTNSFKQRLIELMKSAESTIDIAIWKFADLELAKLLVAKAKSGVRVRLIIDDHSGIGGMDVFGCLTSNPVIQLKAGLQMKAANQKDEASGNKSIIPRRPFIHHHTVIVDDRVIAFGSSNWSYAGFYMNDEANLITDITWITQPFVQVFKLLDRNSKPMTDEMIRVLRDSVLLEQYR